jgi:lipopolysaccharide export system protein LptC
MSGLQALHYPDTDTLEIEQARIRALNEEGGLTVATAQRAISNADGSDVQLLGNVHVLRTSQTAARGSAQPPMEYRGEFLHVLTRADRLQSHLPVVISRGADRFSGNTMSYDNTGSVIELQGQVRSTLTPRKAR